MRVHRVLPATLGAAVLLAGCGGSGSSGAPSRAAASLAAGAINLTSTDMPGFMSTPPAAGTSKVDQELASCAGTSGPSSNIVDVKSPTFSRGTGLQTEGAASAVTVKRSPAIVRRDLAALQSTTARDCLAKFIPAAVGQSATSLRFGPPRIESLTPSGPGADGTFGYRIGLTATVAGQRFKVSFNFLGAAVGRIELTFNDFWIGKPFDLATEQRLFALLVTRARAHRL